MASILGIVGYFNVLPFIAGASIQIGEGYYATTTPVANPGIRTIKNGYGMLGSVVVTGANGAGGFQLYNATTSDVTKRTGAKATSSILIAEIATTTPAGTYVFDADFTDGLLIVATGLPATTTITYK